MDKLECKAAFDVDDAGTITGIAWPFGTADRVGDVIEKGAFGSPARLPMLFAHDQAQAIGVWEAITETEQGLQVKGRLLVEDVHRAREVRALVREKAVAGLSIGFVTKTAKARAGGGRTISALDLHEISIVAVPCHPGATISTVKAATDGPALPKETLMENELKTTPENEPVIERKEFDALKASVEKLVAKANRPTAANTNHPPAGNDNMKTFEAELRQSMLEKKALTVAAPGTAGALVQHELSTTILEKITPRSPMRNLATVVQVGTGLLQIPRLVNSIVPGSVTEVQAKPETEATFEQIDIKNFAMGASFPVSRTSLEDSAINLVEWINGHLVQRFGTLESQWFITGNGTTQAEGVLVSNEVEDIETAAIDTDALLDVFYGVKSDYAINGAWLMNRKTMRVVRGLRDSDGNMLWQSGLQAGQPGLLLGKPVYESDFMPDVADNATPIIFGDFASGYTITDRIAFEPHVDYDKRWNEDIAIFGGRRRVGGKVTMGEALVKLKIAA